MSERPTEITEDNILTVDVTAIATDRRFPELKFENAKRELAKIQKWFLEAQELGYEQLLVRNDINRLSSFKKRLQEHLHNLLTFDNRTTNANAKQEHDNLENKIDGYYNEVYDQLAMRILPFLRQETARSSTDAQELEKQQKATAQAQREYQSLKKEIENELIEIRARRSEVEQEQGKFVAIGLGKDFGDQAESYREDAKKWLRLRTVWFWILLTVVGANLFGYFYLFITNKIGQWPHLDPKEFFTLQYGLVKIALLAILSYAIGFNSRNFNINSGLATTNRHRKNVAETLLNALSSPMTDEAKGEVTREAATTMFKHLPVGYINKEHQSDSGPILEVVKRVSPATKE